MITAEPSETKAIAARSRTMNGTTTYEVFGPFDLIIDLQADTSEELTSVFRGSIRSIFRVSATITQTVLESEVN